MEYITVGHFVSDILNTIPKPYGPDIIDQVYLAIENNPEWLARYKDMSRDHGKGEVDHSIGFNIMGLAGLKDTDHTQKARSTLIEQYAELVPEKNEAGA